MYVCMYVCSSNLKLKEAYQYLLTTQKQYDYFLFIIQFLCSFPENNIRI